MNKKYIKGRALEYWVKHLLESEEYTVFRCAGSHGVADLISINKNTGVVGFIQVKYSEKPRKPSKKEINVFIKGLPKLLLGCFREIWIISKGKRVVKTRVETNEEAYWR